MSDNLVYLGKSAVDPLSDRFWWINDVKAEKPEHGHLQNKKQQIKSIPVPQPAVVKPGSSSSLTQNLQNKDDH